MGNSFKKHRFAFAALAAAGILSGCMSADELAALNQSLEIGTGGEIPQIPSPPLEPSCFNERFVQPEAEISRSIDVLFVMDTSGSMDDNRRKVAEGISAFVSELPADADYQFGVMLAHGSKSKWSGKLYKNGCYQVFSSKTMSLSTIQSKLKSMVLNVPDDAYGEQGEQGTYSLVKGVTTHLETNRAAGFFRSDAALAVVFVADENDICAPYANMTKTPGLTSSEKKLRDRDCKGGIATGDVIAQVKSIQGDRPYLFGAVTHKTLTYGDKAGNDGYGYGYMEIVQATGGVSTEINDGDYTEGLSTMGKLASIKLNLILDFTLAHADVDPATIQAFVDGTSVGLIYDPSGNDVHLEQGGGALSVVDLNYCLKQTPVPSGSGNGSGGGSDGGNGGGSGNGGDDGNGGDNGNPTPIPTPVPTPTYIPPVS